MKVQDMRNKTSKRDAFSTLTPLNYALRIFGLSCIYRDGAKLKYNNPIWKSVLYIIVFFAVAAYSVYFKLQGHETHTRFTFMDAVQVAYLPGYIEYVFDIIYVYKYGRQTNVDYFNLYDYIDSILGTPHYTQIKRCIRNMCILYIFIAAVTTIIELCTWTVHVNWTVIIIYSIELVYLAIRMLAALDVIANCVQVKYRLETIGDILECHYYHTDISPGVDKDVIYAKAWISQDVRKTKLLDQLRTVSNSRQDIFLQLSRCYTLLIEQSDFMNLKYGIRLIICFSTYLLDMVLLLNTVIRISMRTLVSPNAPGYLIVLSSMTRIVTYTLILLGGIYRCEQTYRQTERIIRLINHLLISKNITKEIRETLAELKDVIISRRIVYHALNFFELNYATFVSMLSVVVTYTIILLQNLQ